MMTTYKNSSGREATVERLLGALLMALGIGAMTPRGGMYVILEASGERGWWAMVMLSVGCWVIVVSYLNMPKLRIAMQAILIGVECMVLRKFIQASLWGATFQTIVVIVFAALGIYRITKDLLHERNFGALNEKRTYRGG